MGSGCTPFAYWINQRRFCYRTSSPHNILYFSNTNCDFGVIPWTSDRFFKNYSIDIKIAHFTWKALMFVVCQGSGCILIVHWINQCQLCHRASSTHKILYFSNTKRYFGVITWINDRFLKNYSIHIKITHFTSKSLIFVFSWHLDV